MQTDKEKSAVELGFVPRYAPMTQDQSMMFINVLMGELKSDIPDDQLPFTVKILRTRISGLNLPIKFTLKAEIIASILTDGNPGRMIALLMDCLTKYEGKTITENDIVNIYPNGFYSAESFADYVDNYIKPRLCKWNEIY